tara:strand:- start:979 stop:1917 length:939 start_codon:yes stop_codon:yes gene_type:complete
MKRYTILIFLGLLLIMCICSCKSYNYKEGFDSSKIINTATLAKQNTIINDIGNLGTLANQNKIKDKLTSIEKQIHYATNYKKIYNIQEDNRINEIENITTYQEIINELNNLKLDILYKTEITELPTLEINETVLSKYKNIIKTKYLIDTGTITSDVDEKVYKESDVIFKPPKASFPEDTNDKYFNDNFINDLHIKYGSNASNTHKLMFINNITYDTDYDIPEIYTKGSNGIDIYTDFNKHTNLKEYDSNSKFRKEFNKQVDKYNTDLEYELRIIKQKIETKKKFEKGEYLSSGSGSNDKYLYKRSEYIDDIS